MPQERVCFRLDSLAFPLELTQQGMNQFTLTYGQQVKKGLTFERAGAEIGAAIMHAAACDNLIDTRPLRVA